MKTYTEKEVVKLLADFGTHVAEQCTGKKLEIAGELMKWWKLNILAVIGAKRKVCPVCKKTFEKGWGEFCSQDCWDTDM